MKNTDLLDPVAPLESMDMHARAKELGFSQCVRALRLTLHATPVGWALVAWLVQASVPTDDLLAWIALAALGWGGNVLLIRRIITAGPQRAQHHLGLSAVAILDGICWGLVVLMLMTHEHRLDAWLVIVLCGVASVNLPTYITYPRAFGLLTGAIWITAVASGLALGTRFDASRQLIFGLLMYFALLLYTIRPISVRVIDGIRLQLENADLAERLQQHLAYVKLQASTDALTGHLNRRALDRTLEGYIDAGNSHGFVFSVLMLDIDFFKKINDTYGHGVGDQALQAVSKRLAVPLRSGDLCARFGGEEFVVLLPSAGLHQACEVAERIRLTVAASALETDPPLDATVSIGVATFEVGMSSETLLAAADREVYAAKRNGRNQVRPTLSAEAALQTLA